jgi:hypothetical protein
VEQFAGFLAVQIDWAWTADPIHSAVAVGLNRAAIPMGRLTSAAQLSNGDDLLVIARAEMSNSGTKYALVSNLRPTSAIAGIM